MTKLDYCAMCVFGMYRMLQRSVLFSSCSSFRSFYILLLLLEFAHASTFLLLRGTIYVAVSHNCGQYMGVSPQVDVPEVPSFSKI